MNIMVIKVNKFLSNKFNHKLNIDIVKLNYYWLCLAIKKVYSYLIYMGF